MKNNKKLSIMLLFSVVFVLGLMMSVSAEDLYYDCEHNICNTGSFAYDEEECANTCCPFDEIFCVGLSIIEISTCQELQNINNDLSAEYVLVNDIDCWDFSFTPIGGEFVGVLDGQGYTVSDLHISSTGQLGLFTQIGSWNEDVGVVKNLNLKLIDFDKGWWLILNNKGDVLFRVSSMNLYAMLAYVVDTCSKGITETFPHSGFDFIKMAKELIKRDSKEVKT